MIEIPVAWSIATAIFTGGVAFGGVKVALNGTKRRLDHLEEQEEGASVARGLIGERLASLETKIDMIYDKVK